MTLIAKLKDAIRAHVTPGMHLHFASTPSRSNAAVREVARAYVGQRPGFTISSTGFHSTLHLLPMLGLADRLVACFFGDHYPAPRPNPLYARAAASGVDLEHWSLWSMVSAFRAGAQGDAWAIDRSLAGTGIAADLAKRGSYRAIRDPVRDAPIGLLAAQRPDVVFVHGAAADEDGNVVMSAPLSEGMWSALAATRGVIASVERIAPRAWTRTHAGHVALPAHRVLAVCEEPFGAHPQPFFAHPALGIPSYRDDEQEYERWRGLAADGAVDDAVARMLAAPDGGVAYREAIGPARLYALRTDASETPRRRSKPWALDAQSLAEARRAAHPSAAPQPMVQAPAGPPNAIDRLIISGARHLAQRARAIDARVLFAGIGHAFFAARIAQIQLAREGVRLRLVVETGLYDVDCGPDGHGYPLAYENIARAQRLTSIDDILGVVGAGADNRCLAALGCAQVDRAGNLNSTQVNGQWLTGSGGACDVAAMAQEVVVLGRASPGRLVERVEYVTSPGRAVKSIVTERGVLVRDDAGDWGVTTLAHDPATDAHGALWALREACPWPLDTPFELGFGPPISTSELQVLAALDPEGLYRRRVT
ncbi:MAG TPA: CoA-transferase [Kofleriaceae bacterium]